MIIIHENKLQNERQWPKKYTRKFLEQGLVDYSDIKLGTLLLKKETIDQMLPSFIGKPVIIKHKDVDEKNFTDFAVGYVTDIYFNAIDGWYYVDFLVTHDEGHEKMEEGWGVSCSYKVHQITAGGDYHNIAYEGEIASGTGEHLALVENPRYEECLMVVNDKPCLLYNEKTFLTRKELTNSQEEETMFKIFGKKDEKKGFSPDALIELANGVKVTLKNLVNSYVGKEESHDIDEEAEIELGNGKTAKLKDLVKAHNEKTDKGEDEEEKKEKEPAKKEAENGKKVNNCSCGAEEGKDHMKDCKMYNEKTDDDEKKDEEKEKEVEKKADNEKKEALKSADLHKQTMIKIANASQLDNAVEQGSTSSNSLKDKLERGRKYFGAVGK